MDPEDYDRELRKRAARVARLLAASGRIPAHEEATVAEVQVGVLDRVAHQISDDLGVALVQSLEFVTEEVLVAIAEEFADRP